MLARNLFRQDLYFRLNVLPIRIPLLSERVEDVPLLVDYFVQKYGKGSVKREALIGEDDMRVLMEHDWPGNIRELENLIERATILGTQVSPILEETAHRRRLKVRAQSLGREPDNGRPAIRPGEAAAALPSATAVAEQGAGWEPMSIRNLERRHILQMLGYTGGNRSQAAKLLGINPATLWRKMKLYEISGD